MQDAAVIQAVREKFQALSNDLDERARRRWAATEARALGRGGITSVAIATGISDRTIRNGLAELADPNPLSEHRQRRPGGGRPSSQQTQPKLQDALDRLIDPITRGSPTCALRWTCKSTRRLTTELQEQGFQVAPTTVRRLLKKMNYRLQANRKAEEGKQHPDRDEQFQYIHRRLLAYRRRRNPSVSVDTKKKETLGNMRNSGREWEPKGKPKKVKTHDFPDKEKGKAIPYGVYDIAFDAGGIGLGGLAIAKPREC
jgi:hypothetical protein